LIAVWTTATKGNRLPDGKATITFGKLRPGNLTACSRHTVSTDDSVARTSETLPVAITSSVARFNSPCSGSWIPPLPCTTAASYCACSSDNCDSNFWKNGTRSKQPSKGSQPESQSATAQTCSFCSSISSSDNKRCTSTLWSFGNNEHQLVRRISNHSSHGRTHIFFVFQGSLKGIPLSTMHMCEQHDGNHVCGQQNPHQTCWCRHFQLTSTRNACHALRRNFRRCSRRHLRRNPDNRCC
jgi:hypothetical protein